MSVKKEKLLRLIISLVFAFGIFACMRTTALADESTLLFEGKTMLDGANHSGKGWSYDAATKTFTLNNYKYEASKDEWIFADCMGKITVKLVGENEITIDSSNSCAITFEGETDLSLTGSGKLVVSSQNTAIGADDITIDGCTITAVSSKGYFSAGLWGNNISIKNAVVAAKAGEGHISCGIRADGTLSIINSKVVASGEEYGIVSEYENVEIGSGSIIIADGGEHGIYNDNSEHTIKISKDIKYIAATGGNGAIASYSGVVQNDLEGTGWTDIDGKEGETKINIRDEVINFDEYKKVVFGDPTALNPPVVEPEVDTKPGTTVAPTVSEEATTKVEEKKDASLKVPTLKSIKKEKKALTIKWKKITKKIKGYQFQYSTDPNFEKDVKTVNVSNPKTDMRKVKKLKSKTKYYVRIRSFKKVGSEKVYSNWSKTKSAKTK